MLRLSVGRVLPFTVYTSALTLLVLLSCGQRAYAQASATAELENNLSGCSLPGGVAIPAGSATSVAAILAQSEGGFSMRGSGFSYLGVVGANAQVEFNRVVNTSSGFLRSTAVGRWTDGIDATWDNRFTVSGVDRLRLRYNISATGNVSATRSDRDGFPLSGGSASIVYEYNIAGQLFTGSQSISAGGTLQQTGQWGTLTGEVDLGAAPTGGGRYNLSSINLSLLGFARATVGNAFFPVLDPRNATGNADFGSTLVWQGITGIQALDASGKDIPLPPDFTIGFVGQQTGFNYLNAAPVVAAPEPGALCLFAVAGMSVAGVCLRRRFTPKN